MLRDFRIVVVIPAGRAKHLEILKQYLFLEKNIIDEVQVWLNTTVEDDIKYLKNLCQNPFFRLITPDFEPSFRDINKFFINCVDPNTIYVRLDDDVCWLSPKAIQKLAEFRIENPKYFLVFPNIINNYMNVDYKAGRWCQHIEYQNWYSSGEYAEQKHRYFLDNIDNLSLFTFKRLLCPYKVNINCFCFFGLDFSKFNGLVQRPEESWLTINKPRQIKRHNVIYGEIVVSHFAFGGQREYLNKTSLLEEYRNLIPKKIKMF